MYQHSNGQVHVNFSGYTYYTCMHARLGKFKLPRMNLYYDEYETLSPSPLPLPTTPPRASDSVPAESSSVDYRPQSSRPSASHSPHLPQLPQPAAHDACRTAPPSRPQTRPARTFSLRRSSPRPTTENRRPLAAPAAFPAQSAAQR